MPKRSQLSICWSRMKLWLNIKHSMKWHRTLWKAWNLARSVRKFHMLHVRNKILFYSFLIFMKCKIQTTIYKRNGKKKKTKYSMGHIQKKKLDEMNKWGNVCAEANITLNLYYHPEPNEPHTHMHTHTYRQGIVRSKEKKWEKREKTWIPFGQLPETRHQNAHTHLSTEPCSLDSLNEMLKCARNFDFAANLPTTHPARFWPGCPLMWLRHRSPDSVRHVVRLQINLMSVILPLSGEFLKFHQKSVAYPPTRPDSSPPPPHPNPNPSGLNLEHMLLEGIGCTEVLFFTGACFTYRCL